MRIKFACLLNRRNPVSPFDALGHLINLLAPAWAVAALLALAIKAIWRRESQALAWRRLALWGGLGGTAAVLGGVAWLAHDGKMLGYGLMILGVVLPQWWLSLRLGTKR